MESTTIAVDVAKEVLEVAVSVRPGQVSQQKRLSRTAFMKFCTDLRIPAIVITCSGGRRSPGPVMAIAHRSGATLGCVPFSLLSSQ